MTEEKKQEWHSYFVALHHSLKQWKRWSEDVADALEQGITPPPPPENPPPPPNP